MKLTLKTLKGQIFNLDVEPEATIADIKVKINQQKGLEIETQKIVYRGKPAVDTDTVASLGIKQGDFLVIMNMLKKPQTKPKEEEKKEGKKEEKKQESKPAEKKQTKPQPAPSAQNEAQITELMSMGFDREKCVAALRAAFGNAEVAVDYLINGIPSYAQQNNQGQSQQSSQNVEQVLRALMSTPQFQPIKQMLQDDPTQINAVMQQIMATSPPLYNLIAQNPQAFQRVLMEDLEEGDGEGNNSFDDEGEEGQGQEQSIQITVEDDAAIKRLMGLGFSKIDSAQAYFACDKNQQLAANLLFDRQANGDLDQGLGGGNQGGQNEDEDDDNLFN